MSRRTRFGAALVLAAGGLAAVFILVWSNSGQRFQVTDKDIAEEVKRIGGAASPSPPAPVKLNLKRPVRLAIGGLGLADDEGNRRVGDLVITGLLGAPGFDLIDRQSLDKVVRELSLNLSGLVRAKDAVRAGKLLRADWFVLGTAGKINGTNAIVVRVVDARTGILRDAAVFNTGTDSIGLAGDLAAFIRQSRQRAADARPQVYLAIGTFADLSLNDRLANFPAQLRSSLTAAYRNDKVTLLEREAVDTLMQEVQLDLAGLTDESNSNAAPPFQSAYWFVEGYYQSYGNADLQVELVLSVERMFGRRRQTMFRDAPGDELMRRIKQAVDTTIAQDSGAVALSRMSEARAQMQSGKELSGLDYTDLSWQPYLGNMTQQEAARKRRNLEEALRAFQTVVLLDSTNREARLYLASCLRSPLIGRGDEALDYYRRVLDEPIEDKWANAARYAMFDWFRREPADARQRWFEAAADSTSNKRTAEFFREQARIAAREAVIETGESGNAKAIELAEKKLSDAIQENESGLKGRNIRKGVTVFQDSGFRMRDFVEAFGTNKSAAARALASMVPQWKTQFPDIAPHLIADTLQFQVDTNSPVVAEFASSLEWCIEHSNEVFQAEHFWSRARYSGYAWCADHRLYALAARVMEGYQLYSTSRDAHEFGDEEKIWLAFAYMGAERWQDALKLFDGFADVPVLMHETGPWGRAFTPVLTAREAVYCRKKLGMAPMVDPRRFEMSTNLLCLCDPGGAFTLGDSGIWIAIGDQLVHLDFELNTNLVVRLPKSVSTPVTSLCLNASNVWIGTDGDGLIEFNKASKRARRFRPVDGLMMDRISCLKLAGNALWIGYGVKGDPGRSAPEEQSGGGLGRMDLSTGQINSFTRSLTGGTDAHHFNLGNLASESPDQPPRRRVQALSARSGDEVWFVTDNHQVRHYRMASNTWEALAAGTGGSALSFDTDRLFFGEYQEYYSYTGSATNGPLGLSIFSLPGVARKEIPRPGGLPPRMVSTLTVDGRNLWVGGMGYIALMDLSQNRVRKLAYVRARSVDQIEIGGGYVWAKYDWHLHRAALQGLQ